MKKVRKDKKKTEAMCQLFSFTAVLQVEKQTGRAALVLQNDFFTQLCLQIVKNFAVAVIDIVACTRATVAMKVKVDVGKAQQCGSAHFFLTKLGLVHTRSLCFEDVG